MYKEPAFSTTVLIVKTSSLGDIVQSFSVLQDLHSRFPAVAIDWAVEASFYSIVAAHPLVRRAIPLDIKGKKRLWSSLKELRREKYDLVFDLQGNCKSGAVTLLARGKVKVGYGFRSVREWPNVLATHVRFNVSRAQNIQTFYLSLIERYFQSVAPKKREGIRFEIGTQDRQRISQIVALAPPGLKIMVCPGSKWINKQLSAETWLSFLEKIEEKYNPSFFLIWGNEKEKALCEWLSSKLKAAFIVDKLDLPLWQNLMSEVDLVMAVDSSALHLCATTSTPSFSLFGPTSKEIFKPAGQRHFAIQGNCPYGRVFEKQCPLLRSCPTGACMKQLDSKALFEAFQNQCAFLQL